MAEYRFFGTETILPGGIALSKYGEAIEMEAEVAERLIVESPPALLLPKDLWESIGFTNAELEIYPSALIHGTAPQEFRDKAHQVRLAHDKLRKELIAAKAAPEVAAPAPAAPAVPAPAAPAPAAPPPPSHGSVEPEAARQG